jgi:hypothetical protein
MKALTLKQAEQQHGLYQVVKDTNGNYLYRLLAKEEDAQGMATAYNKAFEEKLMVMVICK